MEGDRYISYQTPLLLAGQNNTDGSLFALSESVSVLHTLFHYDPLAPANLDKIIAPYYRDGALGFHLGYLWFLFLMVPLIWFIFGFLWFQHESKLGGKGKVVTVFH